MNNASKIDLSKINIILIRTLGFNINVDVDNYKKPRYFNFTFNVLTKILREKKLLRYIIEVIIRRADDPQKPLDEVGSCKVEFIYSIDNIEDLVDFSEENKRATISPELAYNLSAISYGTFRGIVHSKFVGTILDIVILPVINPSELVKVNELDAIKEG